MKMSVTPIEVGALRTIGINREKKRAEAKFRGKIETIKPQHY